MVTTVVSGIANEVIQMKTRPLGDIFINRILELEAPFALPLEFFDEATPEAVEPHRHCLSPTAQANGGVARPPQESPRQRIPAAVQRVLPIQEYG